MKFASWVLTFLLEQWTNLFGSTPSCNFLDGFDILENLCHDVVGKSYGDDVPFVQSGHLSPFYMIESYKNTTKSADEVGGDPTPPDREKAMGDAKEVM